MNNPIGAALTPATKTVGAGADGRTAAKANVGAVATSGLEGVIAFDSEICHIDGAAGQLTVRGLPIQEVGDLGFAAAYNFVFSGTLDPDASRRTEEALSLARQRAFAQLDVLRPALRLKHPMHALRAALALFSYSGTSRCEVAIELCGLMAVTVSAWHRTIVGAEEIPPSFDNGHASDLRSMMGLSASTASEGDASIAGGESRALDRYLCTVMEHGVNASTFAARTVASTEASLPLSAIAGLCALEGRLHGGAPGPVLDMLDAVERAGSAERWVIAELQAGRRIMGMGHRVYRARDPRAAVLESACRELSQDNPRIGLALEVERVAEQQLAVMHPGRPLRANVEFFTAILLEALAIPREMFTALFAVGRVVGWAAHVDEQRRTGRLIRPRARYIGPARAGV